LVQNLMAQTINQEQIHHVILYIICYSLEYLDNSNEIKELLHEVLLFQRIILKKSNRQLSKANEYLHLIVAYKK
jgi:hypothetical protein